MNQHRHEGLTLIEVVVSTLLVSTIMLTSLAASANLLRNQAATRAKTEAQTLGTQILDEITAQDFEDRIDAQFGLEPDESLDDRMTFDDIDDYQKYGEANPTHRDGTAINGFADWTYEIEVLMVEAGETTGNKSERLLCANYGHRAFISGVFVLYKYSKQFVINIVVTV